LQDKRKSNDNCANDDIDERFHRSDDKDHLIRTP
jgi:hypothetical protein